VSRRPKEPTQAAMSLMEVVVYCSLLSLFSVMIFLTIPVRSGNSQMALQEAYNEGAAALRLISRELANSSRAKLVVDRSGDKLSFLSAAPEDGGAFEYDTQGNIQWTGWLTYGRQEFSLVRHWNPFSRPSSLSAVPSLTQMTGAPAETVIRDLQSFKVWETAAGCCNFRLTIRVEESDVEVGAAVVVRNP